MIVIDFGAQYHMYCSDITRTVVVGAPSAEQRRMFDTVSRAQAAALRKMRPGARGKSVDATARSLIDRTKYKGRFIHSLGHSVGLAVHDPSMGLSPGSDLVLRPNMVLTNEPGIYVSGFGGVRIEDDVQITRGSPKVMSTAPRNFVEL
jgi:Xaa-Pro dipeptidase